MPTPIVNASRPIAGTKKRYDIDIREFLTTINNAVVHEHLGDLTDSLPANEQALFRSHSPNSFDFRADKVVEFVSQLKYIPPKSISNRCPDAWLFPDETLSKGGGDCEDLALVLAALLTASGISPYCVRVALGTLHMKLANGTTPDHDHCWVMYQNEAGVWEILEPLHVVASAGTKAKAARKAQKAPEVLLTEYVPRYVFNTDHLWLIDSSHGRHMPGFLDYCNKRNRNFWKRFDPSFAAGVHSNIFDAAFLGINLPSGAMSAMKRKSLWLDVNLATYDPRDHFDNAFIPEGWDRVKSHLAKFKADRSDWGSLGAAGHSIADFYAHSSYGHFAVLNSNGSIDPHNPDAPMSIDPTYTAVPADPSLPAFDLTSGEFSTNPDKWQGSGDERAGLWAGKLISGRYAQLHDPKQGFWEAFTSIPKSLTDAPNFNRRGSLPHHNEIAVDDLTRGKDHILYSDASSGPEDRQCYANQFTWRKAAAIKHITAAYDEIVNNGG